MTTYAGADSFPEEITIVDDASSENGASINTPFEGTIDRTRWLKNRIQYLAGLTAATNFGPSYDSKSRKFAKYNPVTREWFGLDYIGVNDDIRATKSIEIWPSATSVPAPQRGSVKAWDLDFSTAGDMLSICNGIDYSWSRTAAGTWAANSGTIGVDPEKPSVLFEPISGHWVVAFKDGTATRVYTSTDLGASWTSRTPPAFTASSYVTIGTDGAGAIVMQGFLGTDCQFSKSIDGGVTWSAASTTALGFTWSAGTYNQPKPVWTGAAWVTIASDLSTHTLVFSSTDGLSWSTVALATAFSCISCAADLLVITEFGSDAGPHAIRGVAVSTDAGATWRWSDYSPPLITDGAVWVAWNGSRFAIFTSGNFASGRVFPGFGIGLGVGAVT